MRDGRVVEKVGRRALTLVVVLLLPSLAMADGGVVACVSGPASKVGVDVMARGGNAVDAAVAVGFAMTVTWPEAGNIGGGGFMLIRPAGPDGKPVLVDYRERAPLAATKDLFVKHGKKAHLTVGVPGSVAGMALAHQKFGKLPWKDLVAPAVRLAEKGFAIEPALARSLNRALAGAKAFPELRRVFAPPPGKKEWSAGDRLVQKELGQTLRRIAERGPAGFYKGETADLLVKEMKAHSGIITHADLAGYEAKLRTPIHGTYRGYDVYGPPPPSSGGTCLVMMLNILENFDLKKHGRYSATTLHLLAETMRRVYADRALHLGDADFVKIPGHLTTKEYAKKLARTIDLGHASRSEAVARDIPLKPESDSTTHYSIIDGAGMAVSTTTTLQNSFGSKVVVPGAGFLLNNEMTDFNPQPGVTTRDGQIGTPANVIAPGKRMLSSMSPTIVVKDGKPVLIAGSPGGRTIINTVLQVVLNVVEFGLPLEDAVASPRMHHQWFPERLQVEARLAELHPGTIEQLRKMGHRIAQVPRQGDAHSIWLDPRSGAYRGVTDWRLIVGKPATAKPR